MMTCPRSTRTRICLLPFVAAFLALTHAAAAQQVNVQASVDDTTVGTEETVVYSVQIQGASMSDLRTPSPPDTEGLTLLQRVPSTQTSISIVNGNMQQSLSFQWTYRPLREGTARILPASVSIRGKNYQTEAITLTVVPQAQRPQRRSVSPRTSLLDRLGADIAEPEEEPTLDARDIFIRATPNAREAYQNQQVTIEYQLFFREGIQLRQSRLTDSWDAEGFWREELDVEPRPIPRTVVENGLRYNTIVLKRVAVFPTRSGNLTIDPLRIESEVYAPIRSSRDPFEQFFARRGRYQPVELASSAVTVKSRPLPEEAPASFKGSVGQFQMTTRIDRTEVEVGQSVQLTATITGAGNIATLDAPVLAPPGIFEQYDPQVNATVNRKGQSVRGTKAFTYVLVPRSNGTFELPPLEFSFLNPETGRYQTLSSDPITIRVTGNPADLPAVSTTSGGLPVDDIAGLMTAPAAWLPTNRTPLHESTWTYAALLLPLLVLGFLFGYNRFATRIATDVTYARNRRAHPLARKHLKQAEALLAENEARPFYEELVRAVLGFIGNRLNIAELGLTHTQLDARLQALGVDAGLRSQLLDLLTESDRMRFAPISPDRTTMEAALDQASRLIVLLDQAFSAPTTTASS